MTIQNGVATLKSQSFLYPCNWYFSRCSRAFTTPNYIVEAEVMGGPYINASSWDKSNRYWTLSEISLYGRLTDADNHYSIRWRPIDYQAEHFYASPTGVNNSFNMLSIFLVKTVAGVDTILDELRFQSCGYTASTYPYFTGNYYKLMLSMQGSVIKGRLKSWNTASEYHSGVYTYRTTTERWEINLSATDPSSVEPSSSYIGKSIKYLAERNYTNP